MQLPQASARLQLVVGHAPCNACHSAECPDRENREWWRSLVREVRRTHSSDAGLVWMLDANGKVGSHECNAIGSHAAERENDNGLMLREALLEFDMFLPATFGECVREEHEQWTWALSVGTIHQLDYVALSDNLRSNGVRAFVDDSVDLATMRPDHRLVACEFTLGWAANGTIDESVGTIGMQSNLSKLARGFGR